MKMVVVDDERLVAEMVCDLLMELEPDAEVTCYSEPEDALAYLTENVVDIAFLDIEIGEHSGIALAKSYKDICPQINIVFITGYSQYLMDAFDIHASGYILKPVRASALRKELDNLRNLPVSKPTRRVRVQTFGSFEVFVDGKPLEFGRTKSRECLAYLIDRKGARVSSEELAAILWEDIPYDRKAQNSMHGVINELMRAFKRVNADDIVFKVSKDIAVDIDKIDCDYYRFLCGDLAAINAFCGEYMTNYSWAEFTLGELCRKVEMN